MDQILVISGFVPIVVTIVDSWKPKTSNLVRQGKMYKLILICCKDATVAELQRAIMAGASKEYIDTVQKVSHAIWSLLEAMKD